MRLFKTLAAAVGVFAATLTALWLVLVLSALIPNSAIRHNITKSALSYKQSEAFSFADGARLNAVSDNYADTILLQISMNMGRGNPFISAVNTEYYDGDEMGEAVGLYLSLIDEDIVPNVDYTRYWHGSAIFIRILHLFTDVRGAKAAGLTAAILFMSLSALLLVKSRHYSLAAALVLSSAAVSVWNIRLSLEYIPAFVIGFMMCALYLLFERKNNASLIYLSVFGGVCTAFLDFLTCETVSILLPLILVSAVRAKENRLGKLSDNLRLYSASGAAWILAYAGTFAAKWLLASILTGENKFKSAFSYAGVRFSGTTEQIGLDNTLARIPLSVMSNLSAMFGGKARLDYARVVVTLGIATVICISVLYLFGKWSAKNKTAVILLSFLGLIVPIRYMVLNNHSLMHNFFTYRALISTVMALFSIILLCVQPSPHGKGQGSKK